MPHAPILPWTTLPSSGALPLLHSFFFHLFGIIIIIRQYKSKDRMMIKADSSRHTIIC